MVLFLIGSVQNRLFDRYLVHVHWDALTIPTHALGRKFIVFLKHFD